jgi:hypothetical protein
MRCTNQIKGIPSQELTQVWREPGSCLFLRNISPPLKTSPKDHIPVKCVCVCVCIDLRITNQSELQHSFFAKQPVTSYHGFIVKDELAALVRVTA